MHDGDSPTLSILMPAFNEVATVEQAIDAATEVDYGFATELIVVDDGSTDGTRELVLNRSRDEGTTVLLHDRNIGKGAALRTALAASRGTLCAVLDADLEYDAADIPALCEPILEGKADACFGVRGFRGHTAYSFRYVLGNRLVTLVTNLLFNVYLGDVMTGQKVVRTDVLRALPLRERGFAIEPEITACLLRRGEQIFEQPVLYSARPREAGKKLTWVDGLRAIRTLVRCRWDIR